MIKHKHNWIVYSTSLCPPLIEVKCKCGSLGIIKKYSKEEWKEAFYAPSKNYIWEDNNRVELWKNIKK